MSDSNYRIVRCMKCSAELPMTEIEMGSLTCDFCGGDIFGISNKEMEPNYDYASAASGYLYKEQRTQ